MDLKRIIESRLRTAFQPEKLLVVDESDQHRGHVAHTAGSRHFAIVIQSSQLRELSQVAAHRQIYALFQDLMPHPLHALRIKVERQ